VLQRARRRAARMRRDFAMIDTMIRG